MKSKKQVEELIIALNRIFIHIRLEEEQFNQLNKVRETLEWVLNDDD